MDIRLRVASFSSLNLLSTASINQYSFKTRCANRPPPRRNNADDEDNGKGDGELSRDWDKAWSKFRKQGKKKKKTTLFSNFSPDKYVSWNPRRSEFPLSEEVDPIKRTERSNLMLWTSPGFTLAGAIVIVTFLLLYTILRPIT